MTAIDPTSTTANDPLAQYRLHPTGSPNSDQFGTNTFLQLLVAQLKYQNPMEPTNGTEFLAQTAQFTMVEKLAHLDQEFTTQSHTQELLAASNLIGRNVHYSINDQPGQGTVSSVKYTIDGPVLRIGTQDIPLSDVLEISPPPTAT